jgi:cyanophycinase-like exopeptidase
MPGTLALVGSGEFLDIMRPVDAALIERAGGAARARVVVIPTAAAPDGPQVVARWIDLGIAHFGDLGAVVEAAPITTRAHADDPRMIAPIAAANLVYFSGGKPDILLRTLVGTGAWAAVQAMYERGGVLAGCSAGAMILGSQLIVPRLRFGWPWAFVQAFGLVPNSLIIPHYDAGAARVGGLLARSLPPGLTLIGVDEQTALVSDATGWQVLGRASVELRRHGWRRAYRAGERLNLG